MPENWELYLYDWVDVGDAIVCPTCRMRGMMESRPFNEWEATPGDGQSECGGKCRCIFMPSMIIDFDTTFQGGKTVLMQLELEKEAYPITLKFEEKIFDRVDELVEEYENITDNWNLPELFYEKNTGEEKIELLEKLLKMIENKSISVEIEKSILQKNKWMEGELKWR